MTLPIQLIVRIHSLALLRRQGISAVVRQALDQHFSRIGLENPFEGLRAPASESSPSLPE